MTPHSTFFSISSTFFVALFSGDSLGGETRGDEGLQCLLLHRCSVGRVRGRSKVMLTWYLFQVFLIMSRGGAGASVWPIVCSCFRYLLL